MGSTRSARLDTNGEVLREVQRHMVRCGVSADTLAAALGVSVRQALCKINGCCSEWMVNDVWRAARLLKVDPATLLP